MVEAISANPQAIQTESHDYYPDIPFMQELLPSRTGATDDNGR